MEFVGQFFFCKKQEGKSIFKKVIFAPKKKSGRFPKVFQKIIFQKKKKKFLKNFSQSGLIFYLGAKIHVLKIDFPPAFCRKKTATTNS